MTDFILTLGTTGLVKADLGLRLYKNSTRLTADEAAITVAEVSATGDYLIDGLPAGQAGYFFTLTYEYPPGAGGAYRWLDQAGAPTTVIAPIRETGLLAADLNLTTYKDGVATADVITAIEVGTVGDYALAGWPDDEPGTWVLRWERSGITYSMGWVIAATPTYRGIVADLIDLYDSTLIATPGIQDYDGSWIPSGQVLSNLLCRIEGEERLIRRQDGQEVTSSMQVYVAGYNNLTVKSHRYTLPARFSPEADIKAIGVNKVDDEEGTLYEVVLFP